MSVAKEELEIDLVAGPRSRRSKAAAVCGRERKSYLSQRMERMSKLMHRMSGIESRPAMKGPGLQKQIDQMRKQMDEMKRDSSMKSPAK